METEVLPGRVVASLSVEANKHTAVAGTAARFLVQFVDGFGQVDFSAMTGSFDFHGRWGHCCVCCDRSVAA